MNDTRLIHLVDDDEAIRHSASFMLRHAGFRVKTYTDGVAFLEAAATAERGCILLDVQMPGMDGLEVQETLNARGMAMPVIVLAGQGDVAVAVRAMKAGAVDFVEKPYAKQTLVDALTRAFERLETRRKELAGQLDLAIARRERLIIETPVAGRWMVVRSELNEVNANDSPNDSRTAPESSVWSGDPLHSVNQGCWLEAGTTIGWIVPNSGIWEIVGQVDEADMPRVRIGAEVTVRSASDGYRARTGRVVAIGVSSEDSARTGDRSSPNGAPLGLFDQGLDSKVGQVRIELGPFDAERDLVAPAFQGEPASITIRTDRESTAARAWRWIGRQVYWPW